MCKDKTKQPKAKERYKVNNWPSYNKSLKERGSLTMWFEEGIEHKWLYAGKRKPGGKVAYSDTAISFCLTVRSLFRLPYRQTEGMVKSLMAMAGLSLPVPSYTQFNRRTKDLAIDLRGSSGDMHIAVDSTGLKVYGEGEWKVRKHGWSKHRTWRKLHLAINVSDQTIEAVKLTGNDKDDASQVASLMDDIKGTVVSFRGDGAYDKKKVREPLVQKNIKQIIPPQENAVIKDLDEAYAGERNKAIEQIKKTSRSEWKQQAGYHKRSLAEVAMFRYKTIFTGTMQSRKTGYEEKEVLFKCTLLNRMKDLGMPESYRAA